MLVAGTALAVVAAVAAAVLVGSDDGDDDVASGGGSGDGSGSAGPDDAAVVAMAYRDASVSTGPVDLRLRFLAADGSVVAERSWSEVEEPTEGASGSQPRGHAPASRKVAVLHPTLHRRPGDRLILRLQLGSSVETDCAEVESVGLEQRIGRRRRA